METRTGFTPGPRLMQYRGDSAEYHSLAEGGEVVGIFTGQNARADALLDAASPDLLAVCADVCEVLPGEQLDEILGASLANNIRAALAKARV